MLEETLHILDQHLVKNDEFLKSEFLSARQIDLRCVGGAGRKSEGKSGERENQKETRGTDYEVVIRYKLMLMLISVCATIEYFQGV